MMDPSECMACNNAIGDWVLWAKVGRRRTLHIVLTRQPSPNESGTLRTMRLPIADVASGIGRPTDPTIYIVAGMGVLDSAAGQKGLLQLSTRYNNRSTGLRPGPAR
jgi:hypothetical protein